MKQKNDKATSYTIRLHTRGTWIWKMYVWLANSILQQRSITRLQILGLGFCHPAFFYLKIISDLQLYDYFGTR